MIMLKPGVNWYKIFGTLKNGLSLIRFGKVDDELGFGTHLVLGYFRAQKAAVAVCEIYVGPHDFGIALVNMKIAIAHWRGFFIIKVGRLRIGWCRRSEDLGPSIKGGWRQGYFYFHLRFPHSLFVKWF